VHRGVDNAKYVFLGPDQIAQRWKVDRATVRRAITAGRLPALNVGTGTKRACWRVRLEDLLAYEKQMTTTEAIA
jgi:excisionase family DNA binding protein